MYGIITLRIWNQRFDFSNLRKAVWEIITYDFSITHKDGISETKKEDLIQYAKKQEHMTDLIEVSESAVTIRANGKKQDAT